MISIVIPAYNEEESVGQVIDDVKKAIQSHKYEYEIIVVDDGSTDNTAQVAGSKGVKLVRHAVNRGIGAARTTGVLHSEGEVIVMIDADSTYPAESIPGLIKEMQNCDMVIGARTQEQGGLRFLRLFAKSAIKIVASYFARANIPDLNSGLRAMRKSVVLKYKKFLPINHSWVSTITLVMLYNGYRVKFIPIKYFKRAGRSTFHPIKHSYTYAALVIRSIMYFDPLRFFLPLSLLLFLFGMVKTLVDFIVTHTIQESDIIIFFMAIFIFVLGLLADLIVTVNKPD